MREHYLARAAAAAAAAPANPPICFLGSESFFFPWTQVQQTVSGRTGIALAHIVPSLDTTRLLAQVLPVRVEPHTKGHIATKIFYMRNRTHAEKGGGESSGERLGKAARSKTLRSWVKQVHGQSEGHGLQAKRLKDGTTT